MQLTSTPGSWLALAIAGALSGCADPARAGGRFLLGAEVEPPDRAVAIAATPAPRPVAGPKSPTGGGGSGTSAVPPRGRGGSGGGSAGGGASGVQLTLGGPAAYEVDRVAGEPLAGNAVGATALAARFGTISGLVIDADGALVVADTLTNQIRRYPPAGAPAILAGDLGGAAGFLGENLTAAASRLSGPLGLALDERSGAIWFADAGNQRVRHFAPGGRVYTAVGGGSDDAATVPDGRSARLDGPAGLAFDGLGNLYVTETGAGRLRCLAPDGRLTTVAGFAAGGVGAIAVARDGRTLWLGDGATLLRVRPLEVPITVEPFATVAGTVTGLAADQAGTLFAAVRTAAGLTQVVRYADGAGVVVAGTEAGGDPSVPVAAPVAALGQAFGGEAVHALATDLRGAGDATTRAGDLYLGNAAGWGELLRLTRVGG